jgi:prevent-host-death family protein
MGNLAGVQGGDARSEAPSAFGRLLLHVRVGGIRMKRMTAATFKSKCLIVIDGVYTRKESVLITKRGKPVAMLVPIEAAGDRDSIFGFMKGKVRIKGDVVRPALTRKEWGNLG